ncbi:hypothetical protein [Actinoplanes derwentensis]|uniref:Uncharacterized protein n=1 Tax=Actinoplanes derwentensis TaxID=113562 RepID=A0A1H2C563_9ACTN|nr:hypothetical protein [Actinoplanes derwentensis]GID84199.1 hypothetical protein Ade03nite_31230 [Actinoplanes derwentensis]SDT65583.1 hypothetical protein SAMN04489716_5259 [Actinoplanes derwentensis]
MPTHTLTQQFATEYAKGAVPGMIRAIRTIKRANNLILIGALAASYLHQAHYLASLGAGMFAWIVPGVFDLAMLSMLTITQTAGMAVDAKRAAMKILSVVVVISAAVNFAAPGPFGLRVIFALVVGLVAGVEWVAAKIRPDFAAIEAREVEVITEVRPKGKLDPDVARARAAKAAATRRAKQEAADEVARTKAARAAERAKARADKEAIDQSELDRFLTQGRVELEPSGAHRAPEQSMIRM